MKPALYFLTFIIYVGFLLFWANKYPKTTPLKVEIENWMARPLFFSLYITLPISVLIGYLVVRDNSYNFVLVLIIMLPIFLLLLDYYSTNPERKSLSVEADRNFASLELINEKPEYAFKGNQVEIILNHDYPFYTSSGYLAGVAINRICKNKYDEYFHVYQIKWREWLDPEIKRIRKSLRLLNLTRNFEKTT